MGKQSYLCKRDKGGKTSVTSQALFVPGRSLNRCKIKIPLPVAASRGTVKLLKAVNLERGLAKVAIF